MKACPGFIGVMALACAVTAQAAATFDGTVGAVAAGTTLSGKFTIPASYGRQVGGNLFHSFASFSVNTGESAIFAGPGNIANIIARVTGGASSWIDGRLGSSIAGANLYLLNPAGIAFGPNAALDLTGSFHASTADVLKLGASGNFPANPGADTILTADAPSAFGFLSAAPAGINLNGSYLAVGKGKGIALVGGNITLADSFIYAPGGKIQIDSAGSPGTVSQDSSGAWTKLDGFARLGSISLSVSSAVQKHVIYDGRGRPIASLSNLDASNYSSFGPGGQIVIRGENLSLANAVVSADTYLFGNGGSVDINARNDLYASNGAAVTADNVYNGNKASLGSNILVKAATVRLDSGAQIHANNFGSAGQGGNIGIEAGNSIRLSGYKSANALTSISAQSDKTSAGQTGSITLTAPKLEVAGGAVVNIGNSYTKSNGSSGTITVNVGDLMLRDGGHISAATAGGSAGGTLHVNASGSVSIGGIDPFGGLSGLDARTMGSGAGGDIWLHTGNLAMSAGGSIQAATFGNGNAGNIHLSADSIKLIGIDRNNRATIGSGSGDRNNANLRGSGNGGLLSVHAGSIAVSGELSGFLSSTFGAGAGGNIQIDAGSLNLTNSGMVEARAYSAGKGGDIAISTGDLLMAHGGSIAAGSVGSGNTGQIKIDAGNSIRLSDNASITTEALTSDGGNIVTNARNLLFVQDSRIATSVKRGNGNGGNISIDPLFVVLKNGNIAANAFGGNGGNILVVAGNFITDPLSLVQASSRLGINGNINIAAPNTDVGQGLALLRESFEDSGMLLNSVCAAKNTEGSSSFIISGRLPVHPEIWKQETRR
ncbi:MAG: filamentous hemagglutinin N-terminal domain-containing protein [Burkholderiales bacterium]|nr:filamentous hemagglutinin N-terminal domain-containing protein [Burkholderiales bacterium]